MKIYKDIENQESAELTDDFIATGLISTSILKYQELHSMLEDKGYDLNEIEEFMLLSLQVFLDEVKNYHDNITNEESE